MKFKSRYNVPSNLSYHTKIEGPSLTSQKYADRVDLNKIIGFESGQLIIKDQQTFLDTFDEGALFDNFGNDQILDCTGLNYQELSNNLANLQNEFFDLPSEVRRKYHDNCNEFLDKMVEYNNKKAQASSVTAEGSDKVGDTISVPSSEATAEKSV